ncbi:MAG: cardiolipin synthase [Oscillospiraceae bacterium]
MISKLFKRILSQTFIVAFLLIAQILLIIAVLLKIKGSAIMSLILNVLSIIVVLHIIGRKENPTFKMAWIVPIMLFPLFGGLFFLLIQMQKLTKSYKKRLDSSYEITAPYIAQRTEVLKDIEKADNNQLDFAYYMNNYGGYPISENTETTYLPTGEKKWTAMINELKKAKRYIFLEYFIIKEGTMWNSVLEILKEKVTQGVDVRVIYDGVGSGSVLPYKYFRKLEQFGIKAKVFSPFVPFLSVLQNNRDHRKICVVDGISAICGGINIGDEYINVEERFGHWKDSSVLLRGDAAYTFAIMFLQMWLLSGSEESNFESFRPLPCESDKFKCDGFSAPYGDCPLDDETVGKFVYLDIINNAKKYVYITTPYLILDNEMTTSLCFASKRGVDVRIILPKIPDKWYAYSVAISHFEELISSGIKIYKYTPGFIHSKTFVADDEISVVGSINLDFRSLYLHYECAVWMFKTKSVIEVFDDFTETLKVSTPVTLEDCTKIGSLHRMLNAVLRLFAPMM